MFAHYTEQCRLSQKEQENTELNVSIKDKLEMCDITKTLPYNVLEIASSETIY